MKHKKVIVLFILLIGILCTGCGMRLVSPEDLVQAPKSNLGQLQQKQAITALLNRDESLIIPGAGMQGAAYQMIDIDADGDDEVLAFFNNKENSFQMGFLVLEVVNGDYQVVAKEPLYGRGIQSASVLDLDGNGSMELLVGIQTGYGVKNELCIYQMTPNGIVDITEDEHLNYDRMKITQTSKGDNVLILANMDTESLVNSTDISIYRYQNLLLSPIFGSSFDGYCGEIASGKLSNADYGISFALRGNHSVRVLLLKEGENEYTVATEQVLPIDYELVENDSLFYDVNSDEITEIVSVCEPETLVEGDTLAEFLKIWMQWDGADGTKLVGAIINNEPEGFSLQIPAEWTEDFYYGFRKDYYGYWVDYYVPGENGIYTELFVFGALDLENWEKAPIKDAIVLGNNPQKNKLYVVIPGKESTNTIKFDINQVVAGLRIEGGEK